MKLLFSISCAILLMPASACATDLAVLHNGFSIRHERREVMGVVTRLYFDSSPHSGYVDVLTSEIASISADEELAPANAKSAQPEQQGLHDYVANASASTGIDPDLIDSVIHAESSYNPHAVSRKGARGLMQLMPGTAAKLGVADAFDPQANVAGGSRYLRDLLLEYHSDMAKALAAYNAGPERVNQYHGVPPYRETSSYVARVISDFNRRKLAAGQVASKPERGCKNSRATAHAAECSAKSPTPK